MSKSKPLPDLNLLRERFDISECGLVWKVVAGNGKIKPGCIAGGLKKTGVRKWYWYVHIGGHGEFLVHRIVFYMANEIDPGGMFIDHIDGNTSNNDPSNLRIASRSENCKNQHFMEFPSKTGSRGVHMADSKKNRYAVHLRINGKQRHLGSFMTVEDATEFADLARDMAHGEFAGVNHGARFKRYRCTDKGIGK